ncbi:MAG: GYD domain-containing protein [Dehalococcoidia bacterium]|nr:GYD domain-containing protein [Dehalococcoidia bacterium]
MAQYIILLTLTPDGRERLAADPHSLVSIAHSLESETTRFLGLYGVLGRIDAVAILDAPDNESAARFSLDLGVLAGAQAETLPAVRLGALYESRGPAERETPADDDQLLC